MAGRLVARPAITPIFAGARHDRGTGPATKRGGLLRPHPCLVAWHQRWKEQGLPVSDVVVEPWGMVEFHVKDPSGN